MFSSNSSTVSGDANYIEDIFSSYLYTGNNAAQTITNGIDLAGKGGMVWQKSRNTVNSYAHRLSDTNRGAGNTLRSESTAASAVTGGTSSFTSTGFTLVDSESNQSTDNYVSWTFRKQPKFFDVVTYTGDSVPGRTVAHNLGSVPGVLIVKRVDSAGQWMVYHRSLGNTKYLGLNVTDAETTSASAWNNTTPTSTVFTLGDYTNTNNAGTLYVAYLFAHDAGGFGLTGTDNVVSCGSYTGNGSTNGPEVTLGYEPQWVMVKRTDSTGSWLMYDVMRDASLTGFAELLANSSGAEYALSTGPRVYPTATGFKIGTDVTFLNNSGSPYIYIAIRRGPMKVPTDGTKVFAPQFNVQNQTPMFISGFPVDFALDRYLTQGYGGSNKNYAQSRLTTSKRLLTSSTDAEVDNQDSYSYNNGWTKTAGQAGDSSGAYISWMFQRAPGFFDEVCYTGTGSAMTILHNLGVPPEMVIVKNRSLVERWNLYHKFFYPIYGPPYNGIALNTTEAFVGRTMLAAEPTSVNFQAAAGNIQQSGSNYVAYLFATCAGVSKVGSYTGTGTTLQINCGFTAGARFVLIKRTDSTGDWYVWDSARGIVSGDDPYILLNTTAAEVTNTDYIDPVASGFEISSTAPAAINASGGSFIFLAIS